MAFTKIEQSEINSGGALRLPDRPSETMPPQAIKAKLDYPAKEVLFPAYNRLIDELEDVTAADSIGAVAPSGVRGNTVQKILNNISSSISGAVTTVEEMKETVEGLEESVGDLSETVSGLSETVGVLEESAHTHNNKALLDTYNQSNTDLAVAVLNSHYHDNKGLLDSYTQENEDIVVAVQLAHDHDNKSLLDSYNVSNEYIVEAVEKMHTHSNSSVLDALSTQLGDLYYDNNKVGGVNTVNGKEGKVTLSASDVHALPDDTHIPTISVTQVQTSGTRIAVIEVDGVGTNIYSPEGAGTGDMKKSDYDSDSTVRNAGGIKPYVTSQISSVITSVSGKISEIRGVTSGIDGAVVYQQTKDGTNWDNKIAYVRGFTAKADKVSDAVSGNFAGLDSNGNLTDSGHKHSDYLTVTAYDSNSVVANAGGIDRYVTSQISTAITSALTASY